MCLLQPKFTREQIERVCVETLRVNGMADGYLRPMVFVGEGAMGIYAPQQPGPHRGHRVEVGRVPGRGGAEERHPRQDQLVRAPPHQREPVEGQDERPVHEQRARQARGQARRLRRGHPARRRTATSARARARTSSSCRKGVLYTPDLSCSILEGITRDTVITLAREMGLPVVEMPPHARPALARRRGVLHRHRGRGHARARGRQPHRSATGRSGPITKQIQARFFDVVRGSDASHPEWLTRV